MTEPLFPLLDRFVAREAPPAALRARILAEARPAPRRRLAFRLPRLVGVAGSLAAAGAAVVALALGVVAGGGPVRATLSAAALEGTASVERGTLVVDLRRAEPPPPGHHYELWVLPRGSDAMEPVAAFAPRGGRVRLELDLRGSQLRAIDVSLEDDGGPPTHSGVSVASGTFAAG
ncbi:MAG: anti-sigma factor domain-containing protein [Pseudomonadota bacterium]